MSTNFTNINDPTEISALLERLRASKAWAELQAESTSNDVPSSKKPAVAQPSVSVNPPSVGTTPSVASLLSQLSSSGNVTSPALHGSASSSNTFTTPDVPTDSIHTHRPATIEAISDVRNLSFHQSLIHLTRLSEDAAFVSTIAKLRQEQHELEKQLWKEREAIYSKQVEKVEIAVTKLDRAKMLGTGISSSEANTMKRVFEKELQRFDQNRVIPAWEGLVARQQTALEKSSVPTMFVTDASPDRERQRKIMQILEGIVSGNGPR